MGAADDPLATTKARLELRALFLASPEEAQAARVRVRSRIERFRAASLHKRLWAVQEGLIAIERSKRKALRWLATRAAKDRPSRKDSDAWRMAACALRRLRTANPEDHSRLLAEIVAIDALEAHLDIYARRWLKAHGEPKEWTPTAEKLKKERCEQLTRTEDATRRPAMMIARNLVAVLEEGIEEPRHIEEWWDIAVMLLVALDPEADHAALGISDLLGWYEGDDPTQDLFKGSEEVRTLVWASMPEGKREEAARQLDLLTQSAAMHLRSKVNADAVSGRGTPHLERVRAEKAEALKKWVWQHEVGFLRGAAWKCTRHHFPSWFLPMVDGENHPQWAARCDWEEYPRSWIGDMIRPFLRELRLRADWVGVDPQRLLEYVPDRPNDERQGRIAFMADFTSRVYATLEDAKHQVELEEELVLTFAEDTEWRERYHDIFDVVEGRLEQLKWRPELASAAREEARNSEGRELASSLILEQSAPLATANPAKAVFPTEGTVNNRADEVQHGSDSKTEWQGEGDERNREKSSVLHAAVLRRSGNDWLVGYDGELKPMAHRIGFLYIQELVANPNRRIPAASLFRLREAGSDGIDADATSADGLEERESPNEGADDVLDETAKAQIKESIRALIAEQQDLDEIGGNDERRALIQEEVDRLAAELRKGSGLGGRRRKLNDPDRRQRRSVGQQISRAITAIKKEVGPLGAHLEAAIEGESSEAPEYRPNAKLTWDLGDARLP